MEKKFTVTVETYGGTIPQRLSWDRRHPFSDEQCLSCPHTDCSAGCERDIKTKWERDLWEQENPAPQVGGRYGKRLLGYAPEDRERVKVKVR
jgi:hypothetical protein